MRLPRRSSRLPPPAPSSPSRLSRLCRRRSRHRDDRYRYPLYAPPDDLLRVELFDLFPELEGKRVRGRLDGRRVVPYWTRADIEAGRAPLAGKELVWVDDAIDAFFLHIQGS